VKTPAHAPRRKHAPPGPIEASDRWDASPAILSEEFVPEDTGIPAIDELREPHRQAVAELRTAQAALREQEAAYDEEDDEYRSDVAAGEADPVELTPERERALTLQVLTERVKTARSAVINSAQTVMVTVAAEEDVWRQLLDTRATIHSDARAEAERLLQEAWAAEFRLTCLGTWFTRIVQGQPATFLTGEHVDRERPPRPREGWTPTSTSGVVSA
jgi:hypothetical protein